ncbi:LysR family transcriptional regulator [Bradyrhizobium sp. 141]|uniref:LysR family transcriptional regulator n=1 Tax=Bradyrhizobium sp. 141 TaxID=2782617 RepID=UPI001FFA8CB8|nr:LysR family transcriptional regulator [Bradyrhizobium sp. 141]MCK1716566.1 LysR family transcriptional regulator [Bradyrhizobium sp. 141]
MPPIELRQLRYFMYLADELSFSRAARRASISQSSMTDQLQRLEDVLGVRLVDRNRRNVCLTPAGSVLRREGQDLLERIEALADKTRAAGGISRERLRIGYSEMALSSPMPRIIQNFRHRYPDTDTILLEQSSNGSERALLHGTFDCLFVPDLQAHPRISSLGIGDDAVLACMPDSSRLLDSPSVYPEQFREEPIILPEEGSRFGDRIMAAFARADVRPKIAARMSRASAILTLVAAEAGIGFIPLSLVGLVPSGVGVRPFANPPLTIPFALVWRNDPVNCVVERFVAIARETVGQADKPVGERTTAISSA